MPLLILLIFGLGAVASVTSGPTPAGLDEFVDRFLPPHVTAQGQDPFLPIERLLGVIAAARARFSLIAIPVFIWFATRLFAGVRTSLNHIYDVSVRPLPHRHWLLAYLLGKLRDLRMVLATLTLFLFSTSLTTLLVLAEAWGRERLPALGFVMHGFGRLLGEAFAFGGLVLLFLLLYLYAAARRPPWKGALVAALFTTVAFEVAKRLFGLYLFGTMGPGRFTVDATIAAATLFVIWVYYSALVFLLGGVVAETWELRELQERQRG